MNTLEKQQVFRPRKVLPCVAAEAEVTVGMDGGGDGDRGDVAHPPQAVLPPLCLAYPLVTYQIR